MRYPALALLLASSACRSPATVAPDLTTAQAPALAPIPAAAATPSTPDLAALYRDHARAIVFIRAIRREVRNEGGEEVTDTSVNSGSGVVLADGRILTACHVLRFGPDDEVSAEEIEVILGEPHAKTGMLHAGARLEAKEIRCDHERDLAILRVRSDFTPTATLDIADADPKPGDVVSSLGHSWRGFPWTIRGCVVTGLGVPRETSTELLSAPTAKDTERRRGDLESMTVIQAACTDYPLSGSPLLDAAGHTLGVLQFSRFETDVAVPIKWYFFIAATEIQAFLAE